MSREPGGSNTQCVLPGGLEMRSWTDAAVSNPTGQQKVTAQLCHTQRTRRVALTPPGGQGVMSQWDPRTSERAPEPTGHYRHLGTPPRAALGWDAGTCTS